MVKKNNKIIMDEDILKYLDIDNLPDAKPKHSIEEVKAEIMSSFISPTAPDKVKRKNDPLAQFNYITLRDFEKRVYLWMIEGWTNSRIINELNENFALSENTSKALIRKVTRSFSIKEVEDVVMLKSKYIELYTDLYRRALEKKDVLTAQKILDSLVRLQGLASVKIESRIENVYKIEF